MLEKLPGANYSWIWRTRLPENETLESMLDHAAANGAGYIILRLGQGDHRSRRVMFEPRPGEFWYGGKVDRDGYGDVATPLHASDKLAPSDAPLMQILDMCQERGLKVFVSLTANECLTTKLWAYHPYKRDRLNAADRPDQQGAPGWLDSPSQFFSDRQAREAFKRFIDAFVLNFGAHPALWAIDLGNELSFQVSRSNDAHNQAFLAWIGEMSAYLWERLPGPNANKPLVGISKMTLPATKRGNACPQHIKVPSEKRLLIWHAYSVMPRTLATIKEIAHHWLFDKFPGATLIVNEFWAFAANGQPLNPTPQDINIPLNAHAEPEFEAMSYAPYPHERMFPFVAAAIPGFTGVARWYRYVDGEQGKQFKDTIMRVVELARPCSEAQPASVGSVRHTIPDEFDFQCAALDHNRLNFVLVGEGERVVDFGVVGAWRLTTWAWDNDDVARVIDARAVDGRAVDLDFANYRRGFCAGFLERIHQPPEPESAPMMTGTQYKMEPGGQVVTFERG